MTGFRVPPAGWCGPRRRGRGLAPDLFTFGKVMGGGFPAAAFGGRADVMAQLAPAGPGLPGRHAVREPGRDRRRAGHAARLPPTTSTPTSTRPPTGWPAAVADGAGRGGRAARRPARRQHVQRLLHRRRRPVRDYDERAAAGPARRFAAFFHAMLDRGVYLPPSAFEAWFVSAAHDDARPRPGGRRPARRPPAPRPRAAATARMSRMSRARPSSTCCATARCTTRRGCSTAGCPATTSPSSAGRWPSGSPSTSPTATSPLVVASPLERAQETAAPVAAGARPAGRHRRRG